MALSTIPCGDPLHGSRVLFGNLLTGELQPVFAQIAAKSRVRDLMLVGDLTLSQSTV
jgi:hypothetical protein